MWKKQKWEGKVKKKTTKKIIIIIIRTRDREFRKSSAKFFAYLQNIEVKMATSEDRKAF